MVWNKEEIPCNMPYAYCSAAYAVKIRLRLQSPGDSSRVTTLDIKINYLQIIIIKNGLTSNKLSNSATPPGSLCLFTTFTGCIHTTRPLFIVLLLMVPSQTVLELTSHYMRRTRTPNGSDVPDKDGSATGCPG